MNAFILANDAMIKSLSGGKHPSKKARTAVEKSATVTGDSDDRDEVSKYKIAQKSSDPEIAE